MTALANVDDVLALFERHGDDTYGEDVTQNQHALQCAAIAEADGASEALIVAALLHDVGHLVHLDETGEVADAQVVDDVHEATGARALARLFGPEVTGPIALHVTAKRYRCATEPGYLDGLSPASVLSLAIQGGPLDADACATFAAHPAAAEAIRLRGYDDWGKLDDVDVPGWDHYRPMLERLARS
jgi:phosphonate degradation associated HDIG domain protein